MPTLTGLSPGPAIETFSIPLTPITSLNLLLLASNQQNCSTTPANYHTSADKRSKVNYRVCRSPTGAKIAR